MAENSLASLSRDQIRLGEDGLTYTRTTKPTALQAKSFELLGLKGL